MNRQKISQLVTGSMLASSILFSIGTSSVFADEEVPTESTVNNNVNTAVDANENTVESTETQGEEAAVTVESPDDSSIKTDEAAVQNEQTPIKDLDQETEEAPSLVPGDFFYFVKIMAEKIRLAFTINDYKEAKLLADFSAERIAEANTLFADGKTEEAANLLKEASATIEQAGDKLTDSEKATEDNAASDTDTSKEATGEVEVKLAHNIDSLTAALGKVKNPTAQQAIMKNIQKSFTRLGEKAAGLEEKDSKPEQKADHVTTNGKTRTAAEKNTTKLGLQNKVSNHENVVTEAEQGKAKVVTDQQSAATKENLPKVNNATAVPPSQTGTEKTKERKQLAPAKVEEKKQVTKEMVVEKQEETKNRVEEKINEKGNNRGNH